MTTLTLPDAARPAMPDLLAEIFRREPLFAAMGLLMVALMAPSGFAFLVDTRTLDGVNVWMKPLKFQASLAVYLLTLAFFAGFLPAGMTGRRRYRVFAAIVVACIMAEMVWLMVTAANGVGSHFNESTPLLAVIYPTMGLFAITLTSATLVYGVAIARDHASPLAPALRQSIGLGLVITFALTVVTAGYMATSSGHFVGGARSDMEALPILGWARDGGDLRVAHFFATHAMHFIPAFGLVYRRAQGDGGVGAVRLFAVAYAAFVVWCFAEALMGRPFLPMIG